MTAKKNPEDLQTRGAKCKYKPEMCKTVIDLGKEGKSKAQIASILEIAKSTLYEWEKEFPEFSDAISLAMTHSQAWWEDHGQNYLVNDPESSSLNTSLWNKQVSARFPDDYTDKTKIESLMRVSHESDDPLTEIYDELHSTPADTQGSSEA